MGSVVEDDGHAVVDAGDVAVGAVGEEGAGEAALVHGEEGGDAGEAAIAGLEVEGLAVGLAPFVPADRRHEGAGAAHGIAPERLARGFLGSGVVREAG